MLPLLIVCPQMHARRSITGRFLSNSAKFHKKTWKFCDKRQTLHSAQNSMARGKLWALHITVCMYNCCGTQYSKKNSSSNLCSYPQKIIFTQMLCIGHTHILVLRINWLLCCSNSRLSWVLQKRTLRPVHTNNNLEATLSTL